MSNNALLQLQYINKDIEAIRKEILEKVPVLTEGKWSNLNESDSGVAILELLAGMVSNLHYYQDMIAKEIYLPTASQRKSLVRLLRLIGYEINGYTSAKGNVTLAVENNQFPVYPVNIPQYTELSSGGTTSSAIPFVTLTECTLTSPYDKKTVPVIQGTLINNTFVSDGTKNQKFFIDVERQDKSFISVYLNNDPLSEWTRVDSFFNSSSQSKHFKIEIDELSRLYLIFGDGTFGFVPPTFAEIKVTTIQTSGSEGNVGSSAITRVTSQIFDGATVNPKPVVISCINASPITGGAYPEELDRAKETAQGNLFGLNRAISKGDYAAILRTIPAITKATAWGEQDETYPDYRLMKRVQVCFFCKDFPDLLDPAQKSAYDSFRETFARPLLLQKIPVTTRIVFVYPQLKHIYAKIHLGINTDIYDPILIMDQVKQNILSYYSIDNVYFGQPIQISTLTNLCNSVEGVSWAKIARLGSFPVPQVIKDGNTILVDDPLKDTVPTDLAIGKWELPTFLDKSINVTSTAPNQDHIKIAMPNVFDPEFALNNIGLFSVTVQNPDNQQDTLLKGINLIPPANIPHIEITYSSNVESAVAAAGYYGKPAGDSSVYWTRI